MRHMITCFAEGKPGSWEAVCLEYDIAVQGESLEEVAASLSVAVRMFLESLHDLPEDERRRLLNRRVPFFTRLRFAWYAVIYAVSATLNGSVRDGGKGRAEFTLPCHA